jgi:dTDP-4-dehydrorhamnose reductase
MLRLGKERDELNVVSDQIGSPTYATDLAGAILEIIKNKEFREENQTTQIYHYSNKGEISWCDFAKEIFELADIYCAVKPITTKQYPTPAKRPITSLLDNNKMMQFFNINMSFWKDSLKEIFIND